MEKDAIIIGREWKSPVIRAYINEEGVYAACAISDLEKSMEALLLEKLPDLRRVVTKASINEKVRQAFREAFAEAVQEIKTATARVV